MHSLEKFEQAIRLAAEGLRPSEIAGTLGVSRSTVYGWLNGSLRGPKALPSRDCLGCGEEFIPTHGNQMCCSEGCRVANDRNRRRRCADAARARCIDCGKPLSEGSAWRGVEHCWECHVAHKNAATAARREQIEALWAEGHPVREIADRLGWTRSSINVEINRMRKEGRNVPYRNRGYDRFPEQVR